MKRKKRIILLLLLVCFACGVRGQLQINELMQSNIDCIMDDLNDFPDSWVELYNTGNATVSLKDYSIGTTAEATAAWKLPDVKVQPGSYCLVYCDKEKTGRHTDFRIDADGGSLFLFHNNAREDSVVNIPRQPAPNIAYGRETETSATWGFQETPTPEKQNCQSITSQLLGEPVFSHEGCVLTGSHSIQLTISLPPGVPEDTQIRLTYDGSEPTIYNLPYQGPITIDATRIVRAKLFHAGWLSRPSTTHSFIFFPREMKLPVVSLNTNNIYLNDNKIGIYVEGNYKSGKKNYEFNWRRPVNIEFFTGENEAPVLNQLCETRIMGGATREAKLKSLAVYAHKRFGKKRLKYEFFPDQRPGEKDFKSISLRNAGNDFDYLYMRDAIIQRTMASHVDLDWQAWRPAVVYINGEYRGILNIRERSNEDNIFTNYDGLEDIDMIENWSQLKEGDRDHYDRFRNFYAEHGHTLEEYAQWMDWKEFINLMLMNLYYNNQDFPGNNFVMWRPRTSDGVWRFIAKDTDFGLGLYGSSASYKSIEWLYNPNYDSSRSWANQYTHTRLFRRLMEDPDFEREFIDRGAIYMGDFMNAEGTRAVWDPMYEAVKNEYPHHRELYNRWWPNYDEELTAARQWVENRTASFYQQLADYYKLGTPTPLDINLNIVPNDRQQLNVTFNGVPLSQAMFNGKFFANRAMTISATQENQRPVDGWSVTEVGNNGQINTRQVSGGTLALTMPSCKALHINAIVNDDTAIHDTQQHSWRWQRTGEGILLSGVAEGTVICLYDTSGRMLKRVVANGQDIYLNTNGQQLLILKVGSESIILGRKGA